MPDKAIPCDCLLGRKFITNSNVHVSFKSDKVQIKSSENYINLVKKCNAVMNINYVSDSEHSNMEIKVEDTLPFCVKIGNERYFKRFLFFSQ